MNATNLHIPADLATTECPTCMGLGKEMLGGRLVLCDDCGGLGRVEAFTVYDYEGAFMLDLETFAPYLVPLPKEARRVRHVVVDVHDMPEVDQ